MANRIVDNVYIVDSAAGNTAFSFPTNAKVLGISLIGTEVRFSNTDTTNVLVRMTGNEYRFMGGVYFSSDFKVPVLTGGTAWIYFG